MTDTLCNAIIAALRARGIPAFPEFPEQLPPVPDSRYFVTVSAEQAETGAPVLLPGQGCAVPVVIQLRVRSHACTRENLRALAAQTEDCLRDTFDALRLDVRRTVRGEITYKKTIDRLVTEYMAMIYGMLVGEEDDDGA